jgi:type I restriction enzyme S subunit
MIQDLKPYSSYKDSGVSWLGNVPEHWEILPLGRVLAERKEKNDPIKTSNILSLSLHDGVIPYADKRPGGNKAKADLTAYRLAYPGDIVLNSMNVVVGSVALSKYFGAVSPVYYMLRPRHSHDVVEYFNAIFQNRSFQSSLFGLGNGIMYIQSQSSGKLNTIRLRIPMTKLNRVEIPCPGHDEQASIVRFLNWSNSRIDRAIRAKRRIIALLNEQRQAIIEHAVTRGLDSSPRLRPSGLVWLGDIPEHWEINRLKAVVTEAVAGPYGSSLTKAMYTNRGYRVYGQQQVIPDDFSAGDYYISSAKFTEMRRYRVFPDDVLVSVMGTVGRVAVVPGDAEAGIINPRLVRYRPDFSQVRARYLQLAIQSRPSQDQLAEACKGTTMEGLNMRILDNLVILRPPLSEQDAILAYVQSETGRLSRVIAYTEREMSLIREYRTRLTADVVTGKLDVRGVEVPAIEEGPEESVTEEAGEPDEVEEEAEPLNEETYAD